LTFGTAADFELKLAQTPADLRAAQRLRYDVFVTELGASGALVDHDQQLEKDHYDDFVDHLILSCKKSDRVVGVYRLLRAEAAERAGGFYSEAEYDLTLLKCSGRRVLELGRSCVHPDYRGGAAMHHLWSGLATYVAEHQIEILFGVASFHGTDVSALAQPLSLLYHNHLAPPDLRVRARDEAHQEMNIIPAAQLDRRPAMVQVPSLIKAYLRLGGRVGDGAFIDHEFNTTDVCLIMDTAKLNDRQARIYSGAVK
jgi:putative hemolysin